MSNVCQAPFLPSEYSAPVVYIEQVHFKSLDQICFYAFVSERFLSEAAVARFIVRPKATGEKEGSHA
jgi:hypothetical protein